MSEQAVAPLTAMAAVRDLLDGWSHCGWTPPERWRSPGRWDETTTGGKPHHGATRPNHHTTDADTESRRHGQG